MERWNHPRNTVRYLKERLNELWGMFRVKCTNAQAQHMSTPTFKERHSEMHECKETGKRKDMMTSTAICTDVTYVIYSYWMFFSMAGIQIIKKRGGEMESLLWKINIKTFRYILCLFQSYYKTSKLLFVKRKNSTINSHVPMMSISVIINLWPNLIFSTVLPHFIGSFWYALQITFHACFSISH